MDTRSVARPLVLFAALALMLGMLSVPANAHHKSGHSNGGGKSAEAKSKSKPAKSKPSDGGKPAGDARSKHPSGQNREQNPGPADDEQGKSPSDPDGMENGGADKPGGSGGVYEWDQDGNNGCGNDTDFEDDNKGNCGGLDKAKNACPKQLPEQAGRGKGKKLGHFKDRCADEGGFPLLPLGGPGGPTDVGGLPGATETIETGDIPGGDTTENIVDADGDAGAVGSPVAVAEDGAEVMGVTFERRGLVSAADREAAASGAQERGATAVGALLALTGAAGLGLWLVIAAACVAMGAALLRLGQRPRRPGRPNQQPSWQKSVRSPPGLRVLRQRATLRCVA